MKAPHMMKRLPVISLILISLLVFNACSAKPISPDRDPSTLDPQGPAAAEIAELWWIMLGLSTLVYLLVVGILAAALLRRRRGTPATPPAPEDHTGRPWLIWGGIVMPLVVIGITFGFTIETLAALSNPQEDTAVTIRVVGRRWWWQVSYPEQGIQTANEIHIPAGVPVQIVLESFDVIHSFWVPQLQAKLDLIPGRGNTLVIQADEPGVYRGECAEYCGLQHAHMGFLIIAQSQNDFNEWLSQQQQAATPPLDDLTERGQTVFIEAGCIYCHYIRGLEDEQIDRSEVDLGPDLTHFASRTTLAAASRWNNRGNLGGWISNAQHIKPGVLMPPMELNAEELQALLTYLESLE